MIIGADVGHFAPPTHPSSCLRHNIRPINRNYLVASARLNRPNKFNRECPVPECYREIIISIQRLRNAPYCAPSKLFSAFCTSYPYISNASTAWVRLNPIAVSCLTASTSSSTAGVFVLSGSSRGGVRSCEGAEGSGSALFFFFPNGSRI